MPVSGDLSWSGNLKNDASAVWTYIYETVVSGRPIEMMILTGPHTQNGVTGERADVIIVDASENQGRAERLYNAIEIHPTESDYSPKTVKVAGGVPTYAIRGTGAAPAYSYVYT